MTAIFILIIFVALCAGIDAIDGDGFSVGTVDNDEADSECGDGY